MASSLSIRIYNGYSWTLVLKAWVGALHGQGHGVLFIHNTIKYVVGVCLDNLTKCWCNQCEVTSQPGKQKCVLYSLIYLNEKIVIHL